MDRGASESAQRAYEQLEDASVGFPASVFLLGARLEDLPRQLRVLDASERLSLGSLLRPTPPRWVYLPAYSLASRPVTNGEYLRFLEDPGYEDPARWQRVFEDHAIDQVDHYALPERDVGEVDRLRKTWESYAGVRSFLLAFLRSVLYEVERELDLSPRFAEKKTVWDETRAIDRPRASELAQVAALVARALAPALPVEFRRELIPEERERLAALEQAEETGKKNARRLGLEALDAIIGRLRDRYLDLLKKEGSSRVAPEFERGLAERDYLATDFQVSALKFLDRVRHAVTREDAEKRVPLRKILYPLSWPSDDPRAQSRERPDRLPWEERPVTGISLYEALAYADWVSRAAQDKAVVRLPSEAQLERAASWPVVPGELRGDGGVRETVDARWKLLFPWESRQQGDLASPGDEPLLHPRQIFSEQQDRSPFELEIHELRELVRRTSRSVGERRIEMLLGFQWEWTRDRLSEVEPGYEQLDRAEPLGREHEAIERGKDRAVAATYYCGSSRRGAWFAARGGPRRVGGCAISTRRYGLYPLRGVPDCGFRLAIESRRKAR